MQVPTTHATMLSLHGSGGTEAAQAFHRGHLIIIHSLFLISYFYTIVIATFSCTIYAHVSVKLDISLNIFVQAAGIRKLNFFSNEYLRHDYFFTACKKEQELTGCLYEVSSRPSYHAVYCTSLCKQRQKFDNRRRLLSLKISIS